MAPLLVPFIESNLYMTSNFIIKFIIGQHSHVIVPGLLTGVG